MFKFLTIKAHGCISQKLSISTLVLIPLMKKQSTVELSPEAKRKAALAQNDVADQFIFKKHADAATTITEAALTSKNAAFTIGKAIQALYENNVPTGEKNVFRGIA